MFRRPHRLTVRTTGFQSVNQSSTLCGVMHEKSPVHLVLFSCTTGDEKDGASEGERVGVATRAKRGVVSRFPGGYNMLCKFSIS